MSQSYDYPFGGGPVEGEHEDFPDPPCLSWSPEEVANWIEMSGYPQYRECFTANNIHGKKLILIDASALSCIGVHDFEHIKDIAHRIRELLNVELMPWDRSITLPPKEKLASYLERKSRSGKMADALTYMEFSKIYGDLKFQPPLENRGFLASRVKRNYPPPTDS